MFEPLNLNIDQSKASPAERVQGLLMIGIILLYLYRHPTPHPPQAASLRQLEEENHEAAARLEEVVYRGDMLLEKIQNALADIAQSQLRTRNGAPSQPSPAES